MLKDNKDFYPTNYSNFKILTRGLDLTDAVVFEPCGGKADIIRHIKNDFRGTRIKSCENDENLRHITKSECDEFVCPDLFDATYNDVSECTHIIGNVPFSIQIRFIQHILDIAPDKCVIRLFFNGSSKRMTSTPHGKKLMRDIEKLNGVITLFDGLFSSESERLTDVQVGLLEIIKNEDVDGFEDYFFSSEEESEVLGGYGVQMYNPIRNIVGRYIQAKKEYENFIETVSRYNDIISPLNSNINISLGFAKNNHCDSSEAIDVDTFFKNLLESSWWSVLRLLNMNKYLIEADKKRVHELVKNESKKPFTMRNIYSLVQLIMGTQEDRMYKVVEETFDMLCEHSDQNKYSFYGNETWKTNGGYLVNKKFILPYFHFEKSYIGHPELHYRSRDRADDLLKCLCYVTGQNFSNMETMSDFFRAKKIENTKRKEVVEEVVKRTGLPEEEVFRFHSLFKYIDYSKITNSDEMYDDFIIKRGWRNVDKSREKEIRFIFKETLPVYRDLNLTDSAFDDWYDTKEWGKWYSWNDMLDIRVYKKGTVHAKFRSEELWAMFNQIAVKNKGFSIPPDIINPKTGKKKKS